MQNKILSTFSEETIHRREFLLNKTTGISPCCVHEKMMIKIKTIFSHYFLPELSLLMSPLIGAQAHLNPHSLPTLDCHISPGQRAYYVIRTIALKSDQFSTSTSLLTFVPYMSSIYILPTQWGNPIISKMTSMPLRSS